MLAMAESFSELGQRYEADPQAYARYTPPQLAFLGDPSLRKGFVGANQVGKTFTGAEDSLGRMRGAHPVLGRWRPVPVHGWCVNSSWKQSLVIQRKVWEQLAPGELAAGVRYTHKRGFTGSYIELRNGSTLSFVTANQDTIDLASATLDFIWVDEPPHEHIWGELVARVRKRRGVIFLTMTPIGRPVDWLRLKCDGDPAEEIAPSISTTYAPLTVENCTPQGLPAFQTQAEIDAFAGDLLPIEREQRVNAGWEGVAEGRVFEAFDERCIDEASPPGIIELGIGIDHGAKAGRQCAVLVGVAMMGGRPRVWILDEARSDGRTGVEEDARNILTMLQRNGLKLGQIDWWRGDRAHSGDWRGNQKSNRDLKRAFVTLTGGKSVDALPEPLKRISTPKKWDGSVAYGCRLMNKLMAEQLMTVHPRAVSVIDGFRHWEGDRRDEKKDPVDACRYIVERMVDARKLWRGLSTRLAA
jgi:phage terminase large subunit-like protein